MDATEAKVLDGLIGQSADLGGGAAVAAGDFAVLTGMHVNTKEIVNWTWQTFWWQPNAPTNASATFYSNDPGGPENSNKVDMPPAGENFVKRERRNYAMCTAYNQTKGLGSKEMVICFNPYLETSPHITDGTESNCMTCHGTATYGPYNSRSQGNTLPYPWQGSKPRYYDGPIDFDNDPRFAPYTRTDFSWAIPTNAQ